MKPADFLGQSPGGRAGDREQEAIREQLGRVLTSPGFAGAPRLQRMLEYVAEATLSDRERDLREAVLGVEVFDRDGSFDPGSDSIVRANARRLREKLDAYYANEGQSDPIRIAMPKGHYRLTFRDNPAAGPGAAAREHSPKRRYLGIGVVMVSALVVGLAAFWSLRPEAPATLTERAARLAGVSLGVAAPTVSDGWTETAPTWQIARDLVATLSRETRLRVVPLFGQANELEVDYRLGSTLVRKDESLVLNLELIARDGGYVIWNLDFPITRTGPDGSYLFRKNRLAANLTRSGILFDLVSRDSAGFSSEEARLLYVDAVKFGWLQAVENTVGTPADARIAMLEEAIRLDPEVSGPWSALAGIYAFEAIVHEPDVLERSRLGNQAARRALALAGNDVERALAHAAAGFVKYAVDLDFEAAVRHLEQALAFGHWADNMAYHLGEASRFAGNLEEAARHYELARALGGTAQDPWALINLAITYMYLGRYPEMLSLVEELESSVAEENEARVGPWLRIIAHHHLGETHRAAAELDQALARMSDLPAFVFVAFLPLAGRDEEARELLQRLEAAWESGKRFPCRDPMLASFFLGEEERMFRWLDRAIDQREVIPRLYGVEFEGLRRESERFRAAMARMGNLAIRYDDV